MTLKVIRPGTCSLLVTSPRIGSMHQGLPRGGPADYQSWLLGNALVGNDASTQADECNAMEITLTGPCLQAIQPVTLVLAGSAFDARLVTQTSTKLVKTGHVFQMHEGDVLDIATSKHGMRAYLCTPGGFRSSEVGALAIQSPLKMGDSLLTTSLGRSPLRGRWIEPESWPDQPPPGTLRFLAGSQTEKKLLRQVQHAVFNVTNECSRMGIRLATELMSQHRSDTLLSSPVVPGTLQWPSGGQPILLGVDAQTIGGYPRLGHVISADLDALGQLKPGDVVRFQLTTLEEAERIRQSRYDWQQLWINRLLNAIYS